MENPMFCLTNKAKMNGASLLLQEDIRKQIGECLGSDYFVIPSSIHEVLILPDNGIFQVPELNAMVQLSLIHISSEQVIKQPFQIIKAANNGKTDADLLSGAGFTVYLKSSLTKKADGSYDFDSAKPVVSGENGATEIFTDEKGYACSIPLPFGSYIVRETTTPVSYTHLQ